MWHVISHTEPRGCRHPLGYNIYFFNVLHKDLCTLTLCKLGRPPVKCQIRIRYSTSRQNRIINVIVSPTNLSPASPLSRKLHGARPSKLNQLSLCHTVTATPRAVCCLSLVSCFTNHMYNSGWFHQVCTSTRRTLQQQQSHL